MTLAKNNLGELYFNEFFAWTVIYLHKETQDPKPK